MIPFLVTKCLVCGSGRLHYVFSVAGNRVVRCDDCHLLFTNPQPSDEQLQERARLAAGKTIASGQERISEDFHLDVLRRYYGAQPGRLLCLGCPSELALSAATRGFAVSGADIDEEHRDGVYDLCVIFDQLGRARDPRSLLAAAHGLLRPDGVASVVIPLVDARSNDYKKNRFPADQLFHFRSSDVQSLLISCGFGQILECHDSKKPENHVIHLARKQELRPLGKLSIVMPVFNEGETFASVFDSVLNKQIAGLEIEIIVVESNSTDGTREQVLRYENHPRVKVLLEDKARGKGHAVRTALEHITGDFVIIQDADLEYDLEDYEVLLEPLRRGQAAFVLGARHGGSAWKMRQFNDQPVIAAILNLAHWFFTALINVGFGARLKDPFTMYKVFRRDCLYGLRFECNRFDFDWEIVINFLRKGYRPLEIPVNYRSRSFAEGKKVSLFRDPLTWLRVFIRLRLSHFDPLGEIERQRREKRDRERGIPRHGNAVS